MSVVVAVGPVAASGTSSDDAGRCLLGHPSGDLLNEVVDVADFSSEDSKPKPSPKNHHVLNGEWLVRPFDPPDAAAFIHEDDLPW